MPCLPREELNIKQVEGAMNEQVQRSRSPLRSLVVLPIFMLGCGADPILDRAQKEAATDKAGELKTVTPGAPQSAEPLKGQAPPPATGAPVAPQPGTSPGIPVEPAPGDPSVPPPSGVEPGASLAHTINLSGVVQFSDYKGGIVRIDIFDGDQRDLKARPRVVAVSQISGPGGFTVSVPETVGQVWVSAFNDENGNSRPDPGTDPTGFFVNNPVQLSKGPVADILIQLERLPPPADGGDK